MISLKKLLVGQTVFNKQKGNNLAESHYYAEVVINLIDFEKNLFFDKDGKPYNPKNCFYKKPKI